MGTGPVVMELGQHWREGTRVVCWRCGGGERRGDGEFTPVNRQEEQESQLAFLRLSHFRRVAISGDGCSESHILLINKVAEGAHWFSLACFG